LHPACSLCSKANLPSVFSILNKCPFCILLKKCPFWAKIAVPLWHCNSSPGNDRGPECPTRATTVPLWHCNSSPGNDRGPECPTRATNSDHHRRPYSRLIYWAFFSQRWRIESIALKAGLKRLVLTWTFTRKHDRSIDPNRSYRICIDCQPPPPTHATHATNLALSIRNHQKLIFLLYIRPPFTILYEVHTAIKLSFCKHFNSNFKIVLFYSTAVDV
jgi:hypothetical protein